MLYMITGALLLGGAITVFAIIVSAVIQVTHYLFNNNEDDYWF